MAIKVIAAHMAGGDTRIGNAGEALSAGRFTRRRNMPGEFRRSKSGSGPIDAPSRRRGNNMAAEEGAQAPMLFT
jgi:hypothetical protein